MSCHESLLASWPTLAQWVSENEDNAAFLARLRNAAKEWRDSGEADGLLWRGKAAEDAQRWHAGYTDELPQGEARYLAAVLAQIERSRRQRRGAMAGLIVVLTLVATGMTYLAWQREQAAHQARAETIRAQAETTRAQEEALRARDATLFRGGARVPGRPHDGAFAAARDRGPRAASGLVQPGQTRAGGGSLARCCSATRTT